MLMRSVFFVGFGIAVLSACANKEIPLAGERLDLRPTGNSEAVEVVVGTPAFTVASASVNSSWTHRNGTASHSISHPSLSATPTVRWAKSVGAGNKRGQRIASDPIVAGGRIYTLDADNLVSAFSPSGAALWTTSVALNIEIKGRSKFDSSGGGLAYDNGNLAVTTADGEAMLIDAASGNIRWRHRVSASFASAPAISGNRIVAVSRDNVAYGLNLANGRVEWQQTSGAAGTGVLGTGTPAISGSEAIIAFSSGEVIAVNLASGLTSWSQSITGRRIGVAKSNITAVSGDPVVVGNRIYAGTHSGRLIAIDRKTGERLWTIKEGAIGPVWAAGNSIFVLTDELKLKRLNADDGAQVWDVNLPLFKNVKKSRGSYGHYGPVLAGGRLYVSGSDGLVRVFNPTTGEQVNTLSVNGGAASQPVVAGGRLYVMSSNGQLIAFQ